VWERFERQIKGKFQTDLLKERHPRPLSGKAGEGCLKVNSLFFTTIVISAMHSLSGAGLIVTWAFKKLS
jgi:hypothetical protein